MRPSPSGGCATRDDDAVALRVPSDGSAAFVQRLLARLDVDSVGELALKTPDLDDVFLTLTADRPTAGAATVGSQTKERELV